MTFRPATPDDVPFIVELLREFYGKAGGIYCGIPFDPLSTVQTIIQVLDRDRGVCLVGPSSCAGALLCKFPYNRKAIIAQVAFWFFRSPREATIFDALMKACKAAHATHINAASLYPGNAIDRWYLKRGLRFCERQLMTQL